MTARHLPVLEFFVATRCAAAVRAVIGAAQTAEREWGVATEAARARCPHPEWEYTSDVYESYRECRACGMVASR